MESNPIHDLAIISSTLKPGHKVVHDFISGTVEPCLPCEFGGRTAFTELGVHPEVSACSSAKRKKGKVWNRCCFELPPAPCHNPSERGTPQGCKVKAAT